MYGVHRGFDERAGFGPIHRAILEILDLANSKRAATFRQAQGV
jgi:hypothetical protein